MAETKLAERTPAEGLQTKTQSERFTEKVMAEFQGGVGELQLSTYQRQLIQGYFIGIDRALKTAEEGRLRKNANNSDHTYDEPLSYTWDHVNLNELALDVVHYARMGLDMQQDNHLYAIPYKDNKANQYRMTLMPGYNGIQYIADKYAMDPPVSVTIELVYSTDTFRPIKKSRDNKVESYEFEIVSPFERGEIVGGFGYLEYDDPLKNRLIVMTMRDIEKRKPKYASAEFWGGTKIEWVKGKRQEVETDGWLEEMCLKTIKREVYSAKHLPRDPRKIDDAYQYMLLREAQLAALQAQDVIDIEANTIPLDLQPEPEPREIQQLPTAAEPAPAETKPTDPAGGPDF